MIFSLHLLSYFVRYRPKIKEKTTKHDKTWGKKVSFMTFLIVQLYIGQKHGQYATFNFDLDVSATDVDNNDESVNKHM